MCVLLRPGDVALFAYSAGAQVLPYFTHRCLPRRALAGSGAVGSSSDTPTLQHRQKQSKDRQKAIETHTEMRTQSKV